MAKMDPATDIVLLAGNSHVDLAQKIADRLGIRVGNCTVVHAANRGPVQFNARTPIIGTRL